MNNKNCPTSGFSDATSKLILTAALAGDSSLRYKANTHSVASSSEPVSRSEASGGAKRRGNPFAKAAVIAALAGAMTFGAPALAETEIIPDPTDEKFTQGVFTLTNPSDTKPTTGSYLTLYEIDKAVGPWTVTPKYYDFALKSDYTSFIYGNGSKDLSTTINIPNSTQNITVKYESSTGRLSNMTGNISGGVFAQLPTSGTVGQGGAIKNTSTNKYNITNATFLSNNATQRGGTIYNTGKIGDISNSVFISNRANNDGGGAIDSRNSGSTINKITYSSFINNFAPYGGGTSIYNYSTLNELSFSVFIGNTAGKSGGALMFNGNSTIGTISNSVFIANGANLYVGGAINHVAGTKMKSIIDSTFISNTAGQQGGAIHNNSTITEGIVNSTFISNTSVTGGGAICSTGTIGGIKNSTFLNNRTTSGNGGAIYTSTALTIGADEGKTTSFVGNTASSQGGGIWASNDLTFNANNGTILFQDNKVGSNSNAIYFNGSNKNANFNISNGGSVYMYDKMAGSGTYSVVIKNTGNADSTGTFYMYNDMTNANVTTKTTGNKINIDLSNDETKNVSMRTLSSDNTALYKIDFDGSATPSADAITTTTASSGTVYINDINFYGLTGNEQEGYTQTARILNTPSNALQLGINDALTSDLTLYSDTVGIVDDIVPNVRWNQEFGGYDDTITLKGGFNLDTTSTTNDSLTMTITDKTESKVWTDKYDTLKAWAEQTTTEDRNFNFAETGVDPQAKEYVVTKDLSTATAGNLNINGEVGTEGNILSTINAQDTDSVKHQLFTTGDGTTLTINNVEIKNAKTDTAAITNTSGVVNLNNVKFTDNSTDVNNNSELNITGGTVTINNGITGTGTTDVKGGTLIIPDYAPLQQGTLKVTSGTLKANASNIYTTGNTVENSGTVEFTDGINSNTITGNGLTKISGEVTNSALISQKDLTVTNTGALTSKMSDLAISSNTIRNDGNLELTGANEITLDITKDTTGTGVVKFNNGNMKINSTISDNTVEFTTGTLTFANPATNIANANLSMNGGAINLYNNSIDELSMQNLDINSDILINMDSDIAKGTMDSLKLASFTNVGDNKIKINPHLPANVSTILTNSKIQMSPISKNSTMSASDKINLASSIDMVMPDKIVSPIYIYKPTYNNTTGIMTLSGGGSGDSGYNPAVLAEPAVAQAQIMQVNSIMTNYAFHHVDTCMGHEHGIDSIHATRYANRYAIEETNLIKDDLNTNNPLFIEPDKEGVWFKPFASFENIPLRNGPNVKAINYGALVGYDSQVFNHKHGWDGVWTGYVGYTGSNLHYRNVDSTSNGGLLGATYSLYKGNFFNATTLTAGAMNAEARTMYGNDHMTSLYAGIGNKTGYNINFKEGLFTLQPSLLLSYTFGKTFDYTNSAGVRINSDPIHAIQVSPGLKFFVTTKNGWQPYIAVNMMWNIMDRTHARANNVSLPSMSVKPYIQYGVGLQKVMKDHFMAYGQAMIQNGGRNGISLTAGFRWSIGRNNKKHETVQHQDSTKTVIKSNRHYKESNDKEIQKTYKGQKHVLKG